MGVMLCVWPLFCYSVLCVHLVWQSPRERAGCGCFTLLDTLYKSVFCDSSSWFRRLICRVWLWYFLIILTIFSEYLTSPTVENNTHNNLRNASDIQTIHSETQCYYILFKSNTRLEWSSTGNQKSSDSLSTFKFKRNADSNMLPTCTYYTEEKCLGQIVSCMTKNTM